MPIRSFLTLAAQLVFALVVTLAFSAAAQAQFVTFVSNTGDNARPCTAQAQPCKTLQRAVAATGAGGTIRILDDLAGQGAVAVGKSLTVEGGGHAVIGTITINGASAVVTLRGLQLTSHGALANGVNISSATAVHMDDCVVERYTSSGINLAATTPTRLFVSHTVSRDNGGAGLAADDPNARVTVDDSRFEGNAGAGLYFRAATATVIRSIASGNDTGIGVEGGPVQITETTASENNGSGVAVVSSVAILASSVMNGNHDGLYIDAGASAEVIDSVFTNNRGSGIYNNTGTLYTRKNNTINWNTDDYFAAGTEKTAPAY